MVARLPLHVEMRGEGRALVLAHGFAGSARNWRPQVRALSGRHRVVTYDARGHARSPAPEEPEAYGMEAAVEDLAGVARGSADPRPVVGGLSMGAAVALQLALARRMPLRGLVLASPPAGPESGRGISAHAAAFADAIEREGLEAAGERFAFGPGSGLDPAGAAAVRQGFLEHPAHGLVHTLRGLLARLPRLADLPLAGLALPTLVVVGQRDEASVRVGRELASALPAAELVVIEGAGHVVNLARPGEVSDALGAFLDGLPPGGGA